MLERTAILSILIGSFTFAAAWAKGPTYDDFVKATRGQLKEAGMKRNELRIGESTVVYFTGGRAERTLVLVHGVNDQSGTWAAVAPALLRDYRLVTIDLPGHGESDPKTGPLPMRTMIDALGAVIEATSPGKPVALLGNSMGGWVSILYATEKPKRVSHLVLEDASGMAWDLTKLPLFPKNRDEATTLLRLVHGPDATIPDFLIEAVQSSAVTPQKRVIDAGVLEWLVDARLPFLDMPVTLVWGEHDGLLPLAYAKILKERIAGATLHVIDGAAHIPHRQTPEAFVRILGESLR